MKGFYETVAIVGAIIVLLVMVGIVWGFFHGGLTISAEAQKVEEGAGCPNNCENNPDGARCLTIGSKTFCGCLEKADCKINGVYSGKKCIQNKCK